MKQMRVTRRAPLHHQSFSPSQSPEPNLTRELEREHIVREPRSSSRASWSDEPPAASDGRGGRDGVGAAVYGHRLDAYGELVPLAYRLDPQGIELLQHRDRRLVCGLRSERAHEEWPRRRKLAALNERAASREEVGVRARCRRGARPEVQQEQGHAHVRPELG